MNFERQLDKYEDLKKNNKRIYLNLDKKIYSNPIIEKVFESPWDGYKSAEIAMRNGNECFFTIINDNDDFEFLNEEEYLIIEKLKIENRLKEIRGE